MPAPCGTMAAGGDRDQRGDLTLDVSQDLQTPLIDAQHGRGIAEPDRLQVCQRCAEAALQ